MDSDYRKLQQKNLERIEKYVAKLNKLYSAATSRLIGLSVGVDFDRGKGKQFYFSDYPELEKEVNKIATELATGMEQTILQGTTAEWAKGTNDANGTVDYILEKAGIKSVDSLTDEAIGKLFNNHDSALKAFQKRKIGGMRLSKKVWNLAEHQKIEVELARSIADGTSADELALSIQQYLKEPDKLFRRVRDEYDVLRLSKNAKAYPPGAGTYRSSYKNAMRLARTEINMAYRNAEIESYQDKDYVVGYEVHRSNHPYDCPICEALQGKYPKNFVWSGWHPQCRCYITPILLTEAEIKARRDAIINGKEFDAASSKNNISDAGDGFYKWLSSNRTKILAAQANKTFPYFIKDNEEFMRLPLQILEVMEKAEKSGTHIQGIAESIAKQFGATVTPINYKSFASIKRKCLSDGCLPSDLKDTVRTTIICDEKYIDKVRTALSGRSDCVRLKVQSGDSFFGYTGTIANLDAGGGLIAEIQVNTPQMIFAKEPPSVARSVLGDNVWDTIRRKTGLEGGLGHKYYEQIRVLDSKKDAEKVQELIALSVEYYSHFSLKKAK